MSALPNPLSPPSRVRYPAELTGLRGPTADRAAKQLHLKALHGETEGFVALCYNEKHYLGVGKPWQQVWVLASKAPYHNAIDRAQYVTQASFKGTSKRSPVVAFHNVYADCDYTENERLKHVAPEAVWDMIHAALVAEGLPIPSSVYSTGRNLLLSWQFSEPVPGRYASRWRALIRWLLGRAAPDGEEGPRKGDDTLTRRGRMWGPFRVDRRCTDPARVFRLVGSVNRKSGRTVGLIYPARFEDIRRYGWEELCNAVMPFTREELAEMREARAVEKEAATAVAAAAPSPRKAAQSTRKATTSRKAPDRAKAADGPRTEVANASTTSLWITRLADLERLRHHLFEDGIVTKGHRDAWVFAYALARAWIDGGDPETWVSAVEEHLALDTVSTPEAFTRDTARQVLSTLGNRMNEALAGKKVTYKGLERSPLYAYGTEKLCDLLRVTGAQCAKAGCRTLIAFDAAGLAYRRRIRAEAEAGRRARGGARSHEARATARLATGAEALELKGMGMSVANILARFGCKRSYLYRAMKAAKGSGQDLGGRR